MRCAHAREGAKFRRTLHHGGAGETFCKKPVTKDHLRHGPTGVGKSRWGGLWDQGAHWRGPGLRETEAGQGTPGFSGDQETLCGRATDSGTAQGDGLKP